MEAKEAQGNKEEFLKSAEERQEIAEELVNIPKTYEVAGETLQVGHKGAKTLIALNGCLVNLHRSNNRILEARDAIVKAKTTESAQSFWDVVDKEKEISIKAAIDILFYLINDDPFNNPKFSRDWIEENIPLTPGDNGKNHSVGHQIIQDYSDRMAKSDFFSIALGIPIL